MKTDLAFASATTLMAAQSVEVYEVMYDKRDHFVSVVSSSEMSSYLGIS